MTVFSSLTRVTVGVCAVLATSACATAEVATTNAPILSDSVAEVVARLDNALNAMELDSLSGVVAVAKDGDLIFTGGYGAADAVAGTPFTIDTQVDVGSITKTFTGMAAAGLIATASSRLTTHWPISSQTRRPTRRRSRFNSF